MSKVVLCNCKKMMAIVKSKGSPYRDGAFPSGTGRIIFCGVWLKWARNVTVGKPRR
jgi:hypothetical protein